MVAPDATEGSAREADEHAEHAEHAELPSGLPTDTPPDGPLLGAAALLVDADGSILLGLRRPDRELGPDRWDLIGGHLEPGETPLACLTRELDEELGIVPVTTAPMTALADVSGARPEGSWWQVYRVTAWEGTPWNRAKEEHQELLWFDPKVAAGLPLAHPGYPALFAELEGR